jgi:tetratricopeptide (TPR) repeat protein
MEIELVIPIESRILKIIRSIILWLCVTIGTAAVHAEALGNDCVLTVAKFVSIQGVVEFHRAGELGWRPAELNAPLCVGDRVRVRSRSRAALRLSNESMLRLDQKSAITFVGPVEDKATVLELMNGAIHVITRTPKPFKVRTPIVNASVDGTEFFIGAQPSETRITVYEGQVNAANAQGSLALTDREAAVIHENQPLRKEIMVQPLEAVHWALYYPTLIDYWFEAERKDRLPHLIQNAIDYYRQGRLVEALSELDRSIIDEQTVESLIYRAGLLLMVGRAEEASLDLQQAFRIGPENSDALALQAVIAVVQNRKEEAVSLSSLAIERSPASSVAKLALSYAQQAHFQVEAALTSVEEAVQLDPQHALAWARLAELQMSIGYLDRALQSAEQAVKLNSDLSKTQTVLGFAYLLQIDLRKAQDAFAKAIALDQADPMPRLGMGIALVREGKLEAGRIDIEIAASLDPANSLIRSYLGKAYFEEKRYFLAGTQFDLAKERDPNDPTPWLYDAIQKQTQNRPVEALRDIQKSIELNDNRAVYRSQFLLDQDQAARGSSLARIYENLGFERRALMETAKSLSFDPASYSAHRFLSDAYVNIPRHEIARVSELLQAQLLQPINVNPVQPRMAVADLNIITGTGPAVMGFNEFAPLMERNKAQLVASGVFGSNSTLGDEVVVSALSDRASISLGQFHYNTSGFRENNDQIHNIYNAFMQYAMTPNLNLQAEFRRRESEHGDLLQDFDRTVFRNDSRREIEEYMARAGFRYRLSSNQDLLFSGRYQDRSVRINNEENALRRHGFQIESQHLFRSKYFNSVLGGGTYQLDNDAYRDNIYAYSNFLLLNGLAVTLGLSYDSSSNIFDEDFKKKTSTLNPKIGVQWDIVRDLRLRFAWFEVVKPHLIAQQTLEPTQIAGFNQFFDDLNGSKSSRVGMGVDARLLKNLYIGAEVSERVVHVPVFERRLFTSEESEIVEFEKQKEQVLRSYLYYTPLNFLALRGEFQFEKFVRNDYGNEIKLGGTDPVQIETLSLPLSVEYFHSSGFFTRFGSTFVRQDIVRKRDKEISGWKRNPGITNSGVDSFFLLDWNAGFRLPKRRGILSFEVRNLLNKKFFFRSLNFYQSEATAPRFLPNRTAFLRATFNF